MTEEEWLACEYPEPMLWARRTLTPAGRLLRKKASDRKLRLLACACLRQVWDFMAEEPSRLAVEVGERFADGLASDQERQDARDRAKRMAGASRGLKARLGNAAAEVVRSPSVWEPESVMPMARTGPRDGPRAARLLPGIQAALPRDVFGNPFRDHAILPAWRTATVLALAQAAYDERQLPGGTLDCTNLGVLADALEDSGCADADILEHLRGPGPHIRGCWVVDLILARR